MVTVFWALSNFLVNIMLIFCIKGWKQPFHPVKTPSPPPKLSLSFAKSFPPIIIRNLSAWHH